MSVSVLAEPDTVERWNLSTTTDTVDVVISKGPAEGNQLANWSTIAPRPLRCSKTSGEEHAHARIDREASGDAWEVADTERVEQGPRRDFEVLALVRHCVPASGHIAGYEGLRARKG